MTDNTITYLRQLARAGFWGAVTLKFERGRVVHVRQEQNLKPDELPKSLPSNEGSNHEPTGDYR